jgi:hypothetical protein
MRASLPHTLRERRRSRVARHRRAAAGLASEASRVAGSKTMRAAAPAPARAPGPSPARAADLAVQRVRDAGGPVDEASYACHCGFVFRAAVSTTVACPHCHAPQAW